jgi:hypothetical protein
MADHRIAGIAKMSTTVNFTLSRVILLSAKGTQTLTNLIGNKLR